MQQSWWVYLVRCSDGTLYCGITNDLKKRLKRHNSGKGSKYTRSRLPVIIVFKERLANKSLALVREAQIKKMSRQLKLDLTKSMAHV